MQPRSSLLKINAFSVALKPACLSVFPSVRLSNAWIVTKQKHLAKKFIMTNRKPTMSSPMSLRWTAYVAPKPPKGASEAIFSFSVLKIELFSKKVCPYKVSLCENFQQQSCKAFTGLSSHAQMVGGGRPLVSEILGQSDPPLQKRRLSIDIRS